VDLIPAAWSFGLAAIGLLGLYVSSRGDARGFLFGVVAQMLWIAYAVDTGQYGFLITAGAYGLLYVRNYQRWKGSL